MTTRNRCYLYTEQAWLHSYCWLRSTSSGNLKPGSLAAGSTFLLLLSISFSLSECLAHSRCSIKSGLNWRALLSVSLLGFLYFLSPAAPLGTQDCEQGLEHDCAPVESLKSSLLVSTLAHLFSLPLFSRSSPLHLFPASSPSKPPIFPHVNTLTVLLLLFLNLYYAMWWLSRRQWEFVALKRWPRLVQEKWGRRQRPTQWLNNPRRTYKFLCLLGKEIKFLQWIISTDLKRTQCFLFGSLGWKLKFAFLTNLQVLLLLVWAVQLEITSLYSPVPRASLPLLQGKLLERNCTWETGSTPGLRPRASSSSLPAALAASSL